MPDYNGNTYEFVTKDEIKSTRTIIESIIRKLQKRMRQNYQITFEPILIGSGGRNLVTRIVNGNSGFDFDYNFSIQKGIKVLNEKNFKIAFMNELNAILSETNYKNCENNTHSMTIKIIKKRKITHSCDFAIVYDYEKNGELTQYILKYEKSTGNYFWNAKTLNHNEKLSDLLANSLWTDLKDEYLKLKNNNQDPDKQSFSLFYEAINNVYNRYNWYK